MPHKNCGFLSYKNCSVDNDTRGKLMSIGLGQSLTMSAQLGTNLNKYA